MVDVDARLAELRLPSELRTAEQMEWIHDRFKIDALARLARSTPDYYEQKGSYLPDVSALAHAALMEVVRLLAVLKEQAGKIERLQRETNETFVSVEARALGLLRAIAEEAESLNHHLAVHGPRACNGVRTRVQNIHGLAVTPAVEVTQLRAERDELHERWLGMRDCYDREVRRVGRAERLAHDRGEALREARAYVYDWPIGTTDDPQEQDGGPRDVILQVIDAALAAGVVPPEQET